MKNTNKTITKLVALTLTAVMICTGCSFGGTDDVIPEITLVDEITENGEHAVPISLDWHLSSKEVAKNLGISDIEQYRIENEYTEEQKVLNVYNIKVYLPEFEVNAELCLMFVDKTVLEESEEIADKYAPFFKDNESILVDTTFYIACETQEEIDNNYDVLYDILATIGEDFPSIAPNAYSGNSFSCTNIDEFELSGVEYETQIMLGELSLETYSAQDLLKNVDAFQEELADNPDIRIMRLCFNLEYQ